MEQAPTPLDPAAIVSIANWMQGYPVTIHYDIPGIKRLEDTVRQEGEQIMLTRKMTMKEPLTYLRFETTLPV